jgi:hypothetical protein
VSPSVNIARASQQHRPASTVRACAGRNRCMRQTRVTAPKSSRFRRASSADSGSRPTQRMRIGALRSQTSISTRIVVDAWNGCTKSAPLQHNAHARVTTCIDTHPSTINDELGACAAVRRSRVRRTHHLQRFRSMAMPSPILILQLHPAKCMPIKYALGSRMMLAAVK